MIVPLQVTHFSDPGCPWAWSASPAIAALRWRYGDQLDWRLVMIGLTENGAVYEKRGYTPGSQARGYRKFRHRGMPFATEPRERIHGTWPMCRVVVATRRLAPEQRVRRLPRAAVRAVHEHARSSRTRTSCATRSPGSPASTPTRSSPPPPTPRPSALFEQDRDEARTAEGGPTEFQGKSANTDGRVRFTAPSLRFSNGETTLEAGGFQSFEAYDVWSRTSTRSLERRAPAEDAAEILPEFPDGLTTAEVAQIMAEDKYASDLDAAEDALIARHRRRPGEAPAVRTRRAVGAGATPPRPKLGRGGLGRPSPTGSSSTG